MADVINTQREYFELLADVFRAATGSHPGAFEHNRFETLLMQRESERRGENAVADGIMAILKFREKTLSILEDGAQGLGGMKILLDDNKLFGRKELDAISRLALYSDTVLIPDPVLAWITSPTPAQQIHNVHILESIYQLLRLKPLVDSKSFIPPVLVIPHLHGVGFHSEMAAIWNFLADERRSLYERGMACSPSQFFMSDELPRNTRDALDRERSNQHRFEQLCADTCSALFSASFSSIEEIEEFAVKQRGAFVERVSREGEEFFRDADNEVGADKDKWTAFSEVSEMYESSEHKFEKAWARLQARILINRLQTQFSLIERAQALNSQPLLVARQRGFYFKTIASAKRDALNQRGVLSSKTSSLIRALGDRQFAWLSNVPLNVLAEMRANNENERFRERLFKATADLSGADFEDLNRVSAEVMRAISSMLNEHRREAEEIEHKYKAKYVGMAVKGWLSVGALIVPHFAPLVPASALLPAVPAAMIAGQYVQTKLEERREKRKFSRSILGILATAKGDEVV